MISIKDYAKETGVSYEAVRQRIKRYESDLEGHIQKQGRTQYLDDFAIAFLNEHRLQNPVVLFDKGAGEDFRALQNELQEVKTLAKDYWEQLKQKESTMAILVQQNEEYRLQTNSIARLEADNEAAKEKAAQAEEKALNAERELAEACQRALEAENREKKAQEALKAAEGEIEALKNRKWYQMLFKKEK